MIQVKTKSRLASNDAKELELSDREFDQFCNFLIDNAGIRLSERNKSLVSSRLGRRLRLFGMASFGEYFSYATEVGREAEQQAMLDLLTTNETYFFREPVHFTYLRNQILPEAANNASYRVWSAASSSGEEAYSLAMLLAERMRQSTDWRILGTDINQEVLNRASEGKYPLDYRGNIPPEYLKRYFLKGYDHEAGKMLVSRSLRQHVEFRLFNLNRENWRTVPKFDLIFLRNVMIYFDGQTKQRLLERMTAQIKPGGYLFIGASEAMPAPVNGLTRVTPSIYRREG